MYYLHLTIFAWLHVYLSVEEEARSETVANTQGDRSESLQISIRDTHPSWIHVLIGTLDCITDWKS